MPDEKVYFSQPHRTPKPDGYAIALHFVYYNFVKQHKTLRVIPAMTDGLTKRFISIEDIVNLLTEEAPKKRGNYKKKDLS